MSFFTPSRSNAQTLTIKKEVIINEEGAITGDFRVESDTNTHMIQVDASQNVVAIGADISGMTVESTTDLIVMNDLALERNLIMKGLCVAHGGSRVPDASEYTIDADHGDGADKEYYIICPGGAAANITMPDLDYGDDTTEEGRVIIINNLDGSGAATITGAREGAGDEDEVHTASAGGYAQAQGSTIAYIFDGGDGSATEGSWEILWRYDASPAEEVFKTIVVSGQSDVVAEQMEDTLTLVAGDGMTITTNAGTDTITFASEGGGGGEGEPEGPADFGANATTIPDQFEEHADGDPDDSILFLNATVVKGMAYFLNGTGPTWTLADADAAATATGLIAIALATDSDDDGGDGMMLEGYVRLDVNNYGGTAAVGGKLYLESDTLGTAGHLTFAPPAVSGDIVRLMGYCIIVQGDNDIVIKFNPSPDWIELA